jgi:hypothetical protein
LTLATFAPLVGDVFQLTDGGSDSLALELTRAREIAATENAPREPFALDFSGPADPVLPQSIYKLEHPRLGALEIFIVPVGRDASATSYEAIFA